MRYKQLVVQKLNQMESILNSMNSYISAGDRPSYEKLTETMKDKLEEVQSLINTNDND